MKRIFPRHFRERKKQNIDQKPRQNTIEKHKTNHDTQKQKFAPEKFFKQQP